MPRPTHISIRITENRRANLDALAAIIRSDSDAATIDWALGYALAQLDRDEEPSLAEKIAAYADASRFLVP